MLPILRNSVAGLMSVDPAVVEAAKGMGMTSLQRLLWVEAPLAAPVIMAGARTAAVWTIGAATLATPVGQTSLGNYIFSGLQRRTGSSSSSAAPRPPAWPLPPTSSWVSSKWVSPSAVAGASGPGP